MSKKLTQKRLKEVLHYDPETGIWTRVLPIPGFKVGSIAGSIDDRPSSGYRKITIDGVSYVSSRLAFLYMDGYIPEHQVDHKNRIRHDDRWENLRHVTQQCNLRNKVLYENNKTGVTGVCYIKKHNNYVANINVNSKRKHLGSFSEFINAVIARFEAEKKYWKNGCNKKSPAHELLKKRGII